MRSSEWADYPKPADFPRVGECPDCYGMGLRINHTRRPTTRDTQWGYPTTDSNFLRVCPRCDGTGKVIPAEWLNG